MDGRPAAEGMVLDASDDPLSLRTDTKRGRAQCLKDGADHLADLCLTRNLREKRLLIQELSPKPAQLLVLARPGTSLWKVLTRCLACVSGDRTGLDSRRWEPTRTRPAGISSKRPRRWD